MAMAGQKLLVLAFIFQFSQLSTTEVSEGSPFRQLSGGRICICLDSSWSVTYECTVTDGYGTLWTGSAISKLCEDTPSGILLVHRRFELDNPPIICDNGIIVGKGVRADNDTFTSQLTVTVSPNSSILGDTIVCTHSLNGTMHVVGNVTIELQNSIDNTLTAGNVHISTIDIGLRQLEFAWSPVATFCPAVYVHYNILASNCGSCPTTTNHTTATCTDIPDNGNICKFAVQPVVCGDVQGISNYSLVINSTRTFRGTHSKDVSLSLLTVGIACLAISITVIVVCCCLYMTKKQNNNSRTKSVSNDTVSIQNELQCSTTQTEHKRDSLEYSELEEIPIDLKRLLMKLQGQVSKQWYQFGLALGLPMDVLEEFNHYSEDDCLVEVLDYWLKHHPSQPTWQEITDAQSKIETFNTPKVSGSTKRVVNDKKDASDIPPPKPPRRSSSVTARNSTAPGSKIECEHEYECVQ